MWAIWKWDLKGRQTKLRFLLLLKGLKKTQIHGSVAHLQCPGCQVNAGTGNAFWLEPHKDICSQAVVHVVPEKQESRRLQGTAKLFGLLFLGF